MTDNERAELDFWGRHEFIDTPWGMGCGLCAHRYEDEIHRGELVGA